MSQTTGTDTLSPSRTQGETIALTIAALVLGCAGIYFTQDLIGPAFFALTLVVTVRPLVTWASRHHVPRAISAICAIVLIYTFVLGLFAALGVAVAQLVETLPAYSEKFEALWGNTQTLLARVGVDEALLLERVQGMADTSRIVSVAQSLLTQVTGVGSMLMIMALSIVFLMFDMSHIEGRAASLARTKPEVLDAIIEFTRSVRSYWMVSTIFGLIVAVLDVVALGILGVPMAVTWGVLSFITNYIPNIGFVVGVVPPALLALVDDGPLTALWVIVAYTVLNFVIQTLIQPKFTGDAVGLNTTTTFLSLMFWSAIIGGLGTILAVPLTLFVKALLIDSDPRARWVGLFMAAGDDPLPQQEDEAITPEEVIALDLDGDGTDEVATGEPGSGAGAQ